MAQEHIKVLLIEDNPGDARLIREMMKEAKNISFDLKWRSWLESGLKLIARGGVDVVLLDLGLPDSKGFKTFAKTYALKPQLPIIVLSGLEDEGLAVKAVRNGAQDYLVKGQVDGNLIVRALRYAIERKRAEKIQASIYKISEDAHSAENLEELYRSIHNIITELMPAKNNFYIALYDEASEMFDFPYFVDEYEANPGPQKLGKGLIEYVLRTGKPLLASPDVFEELEKRGEVESIGPPSIDWLGVPLKTNNKTIGVMVVQSYTEGVRYSEEDKNILMFISEQVAMAIERKRSEEVLKESEEKYRIQFEEALDAIFIGDAETGIIINCNNAASKLVGRAKSELVGKHQRILHPPEEITGEFSRTFKRHLKEKEGQTLEAQVITKNGERKDVAIKANLFEFRGKKVLQGIFRDITERKRVERKLKKSFKRLQKSFEQTINAIASSLEMRDPYTAGHQRRVTKLACAIAKEMSLSIEQIEGIRMAGIIHDIGKISIAAEILSKPSRLNEAEMLLVRNHPQVGFDILKGIEFPWPVAKIVLQHHERMDGSGYPAGLSGEDILLEARILAVSDVVEAVCSHRPYRPAFGINKALEEISQNKGILYDSMVVEACLKLFTEKGYKLEQEDESRNFM